MEEKKDIFDRIMALPGLRALEPFYKKYKEILLYLFFGALTTVVSIGSYAVAALGLIMTAVLFWVGHRRYRAVHTTLVQASTDRVRLTSAAPLFLWALAVFVLAVVGAVFAALGIVATLQS